MPIAATRSSVDVRAKPFFQNTGMARRRTTSLSNSLGRAIASMMAVIERVVNNTAIHDGRCPMLRHQGRGRIAYLVRRREGSPRNTTLQISSGPLGQVRALGGLVDVPSRWSELWPTHGEASAAPRQLLASQESFCIWRIKSSVSCG